MQWLGARLTAVHLLNRYHTVCTSFFTFPVLSNVRPLLTYLQLGNHDSERLTVIYFDFEQFKGLEEFQRWAFLATLQDARPTAAGPDEISAELFEKHAPNAPTADKDGIDWGALGFKPFCL